MILKKSSLLAPEFDLGSRMLRRTLPSLGLAWLSLSCLPLGLGGCAYELCPPGSTGDECAELQVGKSILDEPSGGDGASGARATADTDTDMDGVSDAEEQAEGTDPQDSGDAPAWHPEVTAFPRLIFGPEDLAAVTTRFARKDEPFATLASRIRSSCASTPAAYDDPDGMDQAAIYTNANIARNCAFLALVEKDTNAATKAIGILKAMPDDLGKLNMERVDNTDIHVGEALASFAQAYDLLRGASAIDSASQASIESRLMGLAESSYHFYVEVASLWYRWWVNNHNMKMAAGLGMVGMVMNQHPSAAQLVNFATTEIDRVMAHQSWEEGGYAEGLYYMNYGAETMLPFFIAYHRVAQGRSISYTRHCDTTKRVADCEEDEQFYIDDFYTDPHYVNVYGWWVSLMMPDGYGPDFDDANRGGTFHGILQGMTGKAYHRAAWERNTALPYYSRDCQELSVETLVTFNPDQAAAWPSFTSQFNAKTGTAVFRSGWEPDARYMLLLAEYGKMRTGGHEHQDATAVMVHAYGEYLLIDSGYGSWSQHKDVNQPGDHNILLVDGEGPSEGLYETYYGEDAYLENCASEAGFERCDARITFNGITQVRRAYFLDGLRYAVVDRITPESSKDTFDYTQVWHTQGGGETGGTFTQTATGATVSRAKAGLTLAVTGSRGAPVLRNYLDLYGASYGTLKQNSVLAADISGGSMALLTVIDPRPAGSSLATATTLASSGGVAAIKLVQGTETVLTIATEPGTTATISSTVSGVPTVVTDADFVSVRFVSGAYVSHHQEGATTLTVGGVSKL